MSVTRTKGFKTPGCVPCSMSEKAALGKASGSNTADDKDSWVCRDCGKEYETNGGLYYHYKHGQNDCDGLECPECGDANFASVEGVRRHYGRDHDGSIAGDIVECHTCGETKRVQPHRIESQERFFCDHECKSVWQTEEWAGEDHPLSKKVTKECDWCGEDITRTPSEFAGDNAFCNHNCEGRWLSENVVGEDHHNWKGGVSQIVYGSNWKRQREKALERDGYSCVICGASKEEKPNRIDVHHIKHVESHDTKQEAHELRNLVTLCRSHHRKWEGLQLRPDVKHLRDNKT